MATKKIYKLTDTDKVEFKPTQALCPCCLRIWPVERFPNATTVVLRVTAHPHIEFVENLLGEEIAVEREAKCAGSGKVVVHLMADALMNSIRGGKKNAA